MGYEIGLYTSADTKWETAQVRIQRDLKDKGHEVLRRRGMTFSFFVRACIARLIEREQIVHDHRVFTDVHETVDDVVAYLPIVKKNPYMKKII